jgi:hypothetical protein
VPVVQKVASSPDDCLADFPGQAAQQAAYFHLDAGCPPDSQADSWAGFRAGS